MALKAKHVLMVLGSYDQAAHEGIARYAGQHGWHLNVSILKDFQLPAHWQGDGIITSLNSSRELEAYVLNANVPTVDLSIWREDLLFPRVVANNAEIGRLGAVHFLERGFRHCAWYGLATNPVSRTRYQAYAEWLEQAGVECVRLDTFRAQDPEYITERLRALPKPCGIYTKSDYDSAWLANLCLDAGISIPSEIAILGADDNRLICETQQVPLSSVSYDLKQIGYEGARLLDRIMRGEAVGMPLQMIHPDGVVVRQSTDILAVSDGLIRKAIAYLEANYRHPIGVTEVADALEVSRRTLEQRFRKALGSSLKQRLIQLRLSKAKLLLDQSKESIENIAAMTGFCHAPHFSNRFKANFGLSPSRYRADRTAEPRAH